MVPGMVERDRRAIALRHEAELTRESQSGRRRPLPARMLAGVKRPPADIRARSWAGRILPLPRSLVLTKIAAALSDMVRTALRRLGQQGS